jgi:hypothetical protein
MVAIMAQIMMETMQQEDTHDEEQKETHDEEITIDEDRPSSFAPSSLFTPKRAPDEETPPVGRAKIYGGDDFQIELTSIQEATSPLVVLRTTAEKMSAGLMASDEFAKSMQLIHVSNARELPGFVIKTAYDNLTGHKTFRKLLKGEHRNIVINVRHNDEVIFLPFI